MYLWYESENGGDISVMLNSYGVPKLYDKFTSTYTNIEYISDDMIFMDESTKIMYIWYESEGAAGVAVRVNIDGMPKTKSGFPVKYMMKNIVSTKIFVDTEEGVKYLWCKGHYSGGFTVMPTVY